MVLQGGCTAPLEKEGWLWVQSCSYHFSCDYPVFRREEKATPSWCSPARRTKLIASLQTEVLGLCTVPLSLPFPVVPLPEDGIGLSDIAAFHRRSHFSSCDYQTCSYWKDTAFDFSCQNGIELCFIAAEEKYRSKCHDEILNWWLLLLS